MERSPGLVELMAYVFANGNLLGGPYFDFKDWDDFIHRTGVFNEVRLAAFRRFVSICRDVGLVKNESRTFLFLRKCRT